MKSLLFRAKGLRMLYAAATLFFWNHSFNSAIAQSTFTILNDGFNGSVTQSVVSGGNFMSGNSAGADRPQSTAFAFSGSGSFGVSNNTETVETEFSTAGMCSPQMTFKLASWSIGSSTNGADNGDFVLVEISPDGGNTFYPTLEVNGNSNAYWGYGATGVASTAYDGDNNQVNFQPGGGGLRTTDGMSTITVTNLPISRRVMVRITLDNSSNSELWTMDDWVVTGTTVPTLTTTGGYTCGTGSVALSANTNLCGVTPIISWFATSTGGATIQSSSVTSSTYTTPSISTTTTYYAQENVMVGMDVTTANSNSTATNRGLTFDVYSTFTLNSVDIRFRKSSNTVGVITGVIQNSSGTTLHTFTANAAGNNGTIAIVTANVNYTLAPGTNYRIVLSARTNVDRLYTTNGIAAASHFGYGAITGGYANENYNYFYNWNVTGARVGALASVLTSVSPSVSIASSDNDNTFCGGTAVTFTATPVNGGTSPSYQWKVNGANTGTNSATFVTTTLVNADVVSVVMTANNNCQTSNTVTSNGIGNSVTPSVTPSVTITSSDADLSICAGTTVVYSASISNGGSSPQLQWYLNGTAVGNGSSTYNNSVLNNGDIVSCTLTANNVCQTITTANSNSLNMVVQAYVTPSVSISSSDANNTVCNGSSITYTAVPVDGGTSPNYQWILNGNNVGSNAPTFSNAVNAQQVVGLVMTANNACQTTSSATAPNLTIQVLNNVNPSVAITSSDADNDICAGTSVTFTAVPTNGGPSPSYQWKLNGANVGTNNSTYTNSALPDNANVSVVMTANNECQSSAIANGNSIITNVIPNVTPTVSLVSSAAVNTDIAYWNFTNLSSSTVANLTVSNLSQVNNFGTTNPTSTFANSGGAYTGASGGGNFAAAVVTGGLNISTSTYAEFTITPDALYSFTMTGFSAGMRSTGSGPLNYVVRSSVDNYASNIASGTMNNNSNWALKTNVISTMNSSSIGAPITFRIYAYGASGGTAGTANWRLDDLVLNLTVQQAVCSSSNLVYTATPTNGGNPLYQWFVNGIATGDGSNPWTASGLSNGDQVSVQIMADNQCQTTNTANSNVVVANIVQTYSPSVNIVSSDADNSICSGTSVTFTATPSNGGTAPAYQWKLNGGNVGTNATTYTNSALANSDVVTVVLTANNTCQTSATANGNSIATTVINYVTPSVSIVANNAVICPGAGNVVTFTATPTNGGSTPAYQWKVNGANVGTNSTTFSSSTLSGGDNVKVDMLANNQCQTAAMASSSSIAITALTVYNYYQDNDGDGYGNPSTGVSDCTSPLGYVLDNTDCLDNNGDVYPDGFEICNGIDDNCNGDNDEDVELTTYYLDNDGDGFGGATGSIQSCDIPAGYIQLSGDCNDNNANVRPTAQELCSTNYDDDCDGLINEICFPGNDNPNFASNCPLSTSTTFCNTVTGNLQAATASSTFGSGTLSNNPDVWFYFTANAVGMTIRCTPSINDVGLELRTSSGELLKTMNALSAVGDEYMNYDDLTIGNQYYLRVMNMNASAQGGSFTLCARRIVPTTSAFNYTNVYVYNTGCTNVVPTNLSTFTNTTISLTPVGGGAEYTAQGPVAQLGEFLSAAGNSVNYNTVYTGKVTFGSMYPLGGGNTEMLTFTSNMTNTLNVLPLVDLDLSSNYLCPRTWSVGTMIRADRWICGAVKYQWRFEQYLNGQPYLINGNPVVIEQYGTNGSRDIYTLAAYGFLPGSEWRVKVRPVFPNNVHGDYGTDEQCLKFKGALAAAPLIDENEDDFISYESKIVLYPNPSNNGELNLMNEQWLDATVTMHIFDATGKIVLERDYTDSAWIQENAIELANGMYLIQLSWGNESQQLHWMLQR